jgi:uncharacterized membrane protein YebE (DUF533 family)
MRDVRQIIRDQPALDWTYLDEWAQRLNLTDALREARA